MKELKYNNIDVELLTEIEDMDEDVTKLGHYLVSKETKERLKRIDWSPYGDMSIEDVALYIALDCPDRISRAPLDSDDLKEIKKRRDLLDQINKSTNNNTLEI